jgi:zinc protease
LERVGVIHRHLSNGLELYLHEQHFSPVCTVHLCVKAGSLDEGPGEEGMAHALEHMLFKGTETEPEPGAIARRVESAGGDINAYTTFDRTVYELNGPAAFVKDGAKILLGMAHQALLDSEELARELEVIVEEIRRGNDNPNARLSKALFRHAYRGTAMSRPIIGSEESVRAFTAETVRAFYKRWYIPNNMVLVAAGDFDAKKLAEELETQCLAFKPANVPARQRPKLVHWSTCTAPLAEVLAGPFQEARMQLATSCPTLEDDALPRWDVFTSLLGQGDSSRLAHRVKDQLQLAAGIESGTYAPRYPNGLASIGLYARAKDANAALREAVACAAELARQEPSEMEVRRVSTTLRAERIYSVETVEGIVRQALGQLLTGRGLDFEEHYVQCLSRVTPKTVQTTAEEFIDLISRGQFAVCGVISAQSAGDVTNESLVEAAQIGAGHRGAFGGGLPNSAHNQGQASFSESHARSSQLNPAVRQFIIETKNGQTVHVNYRCTDKIPAVAFGLYVPGALASSNDLPLGTSSVLAQMLTRGTETMPYREFVTDLENRAASLHSFHGRDLLGIRGDSLSGDFEHVLRQSFECLFSPGMQPSELVRVLRESEDGVRAQKDSPFAQLSLLIAPLLYGDHLYARPLQGTEDSLQSILLDHIQILWKRIQQTPRWILSVAGDFEERALLESAQELFNRHLASIPGPKETGHSWSFAQAEKAKSPASAGIGFTEMDREQAHLLLGMRGATMTDPDRIALEIAVSILSGQGGRLFEQLREKQSLAYSVSCSQSAGALGGSLAAYIGTSADKAQAAFQGLKAEIERLAAELPSSEELARAQQSMLGGQALDAQQLSYQCAQLAYSDAFGLGFDHFLSFRERVESVTREDVRNALASRLQANPPQLATIGPRGTWQPDPAHLTWAPA